jgi:hypothetical protein
MRPRDRNLARALDEGLRSLHKNQHPLIGIERTESRQALIEQLLESIHRIRFISVILTRDVSPLRGDPSSELFDPIRAAILRTRAGDLDEAFWLVFLFVHFGKHLRTEWRRVRDVYGALGRPAHWDWARTSRDPAAFRRWLATHRKSIGGHFGNHRKYESLNADSARGTGGVVESYIRWIGPPRTHQMLMQAALQQNRADPRKAFDFLFYSMDAVVAFGRTAKFDYLTMLGKLGWTRR